MATLVNEALGVVFVHIPKSAGTSVTRTFEAQSAPDPETPLTDAERQANPRLWSHWVQGDHLPGIEASVAHNVGMQGGREKVPAFHARAVDLRHALGYRRFDALHSFTFVRNPFERMASTYHYTRDNDANPHAAMCRVLGFEQYIVFNCMLTVQLQYDWLHDLNGRPMVDEVFRVEHMAEAEARLGARLFGKPIRFVHENQSTNARRDPSTSWNAVPEWVIDLFVKTYAKDFACTGYATDVSPYKTADIISEEAACGAWERLPQYLAHPVERSMQRRYYLDRLRYITTLDRGENVAAPVPGDTVAG
ncbi:sulfotransferase family 2 domain-containing protein [Sagittula sp. NFXS13]|uniref:sulfotransferase family 2 domain-containing protein n=1 Tax=Sagittula sp. NFXS13 TaxID=2819095 RepID=UPI0032DEA2DC